MVKLKRLLRAQITGGSKQKAAGYGTGSKIRSIAMQLESSASFWRGWPPIKLIQLIVSIIIMIYFSRCAFDDVAVLAKL